MIDSLLELLGLGCPVTRARRRVRILRRERDYHRENLHFHAERSNRLHHALVTAERDLGRVALDNRYRPSAHQLDRR